jgi:NADH-quinone oxidoreductase subunit J
MVLFLFVVMMMDINVENLRAGFWTHFPLAAVVGVVIALEMAAVLMGGFRVVEDPSVITQAPGGLSNTQQLGKLIYTQYLYPLEIAAAILLVAMIAAIALTLRARKDSKYVSPGDQVRVKAADRMMVLKMQASHVSPDPTEAAPTETKV